MNEQLDILIKQSEDLPHWMILPTACYVAMDSALKIAEDVICNAIPLIVAVKLAMLLTLCL